MLVDAQRRAAYLAAYDLFETVQGDEHATALASLPAAEAVATLRGWTEVSFVLAGGPHGARPDAP